MHRFEYNYDPHISTTNSNEIFKKRSLKGTLFIYTQMTTIKRSFSNILDITSLYHYWERDLSIKS